MIQTLGADTKMSATNFKVQQKTLLQIYMKQYCKITEAEMLSYLSRKPN